MGIFKNNKIDGNFISYSIIIPIVSFIIGYSYGYKSVIAMLVLFIGMYCYYSLFLNIIYSIKDKTLSMYMSELIIYFAISITIFVLSYHYYGGAFTLKPLITMLIISIVQSFFIFRE